MDVAFCYNAVERGDYNEIAGQRFQRIDFCLISLEECLSQFKLVGGDRPRGTRGNTEALESSFVARQCGPSLCGLSFELGRGKSDQQLPAPHYPSPTHP